MESAEETMDSIALGACHLAGGIPQIALITTEGEMIIGNTLESLYKIRDIIHSQFSPENLMGGENLKLRND